MIAQNTAIDVNEIRKEAVYLSSAIPDELQALWADREIKEEPPGENELSFIDGIPVLSEGNHTLIVGKKKSRKTLFLVWLISKTTAPVMYFDTEQGRSHVYRLRNKVKHLSGYDMPTFYLRGMSPADRREFISETLKHWPDRPQIVVIDGIRDLMSNINDPVESTDLIVWLEALIKDFGIGVFNVLHLNKNDNNARGHIGTELGNKCFMVIEIEKDQQSGVSLAKCSDSRDEPFETFAFTHSETGLPEIVSMPTNGKTLTEAQTEELLTHVFEGEILGYAELIDQMKAHFTVGINKAKSILAECQRKGLIVKNGASRTKDAKYKLMIN